MPNGFRTVEADQDDEYSTRFPIRVDLICEFASLNGGENSILALIPLLRDQGVQYRVYAPPQGPLADAIVNLGLELRPLSFEYGISFQERREILANGLLHDPPDLYHANSLAMGRILGSLRSELKSPTVAHLRDIVRLSRSALIELGHNDRLLAVSNATRQAHLNAGLDPTRCQVLYNGIDSTRFKPENATKYLHHELGIPPSAPLLCTIGQIGLRKGQDRLLEELESVFETEPQPHLILIGQRWSEKEESVRFEQLLHEKANRPPYRGRVHFLGTRTDVMRLLNEITILVHPAREEPLGRVLLEAGACGVPIVANRVGGTAEIFPEPNMAVLVDPNESGAIGQSVRNLLRDPEKRSQLSQAARKRIVNNFTHEKSALGLLQHYRELVKIKREQKDPAPESNPFP